MLSMIKTAIVFAALIITSVVYSDTQLHPNNGNYATVNGVRLHYLEQGAGPLVILLHGWPETSYEWRFTIDALSKKYRVVAPDLRGLGLSERTLQGYDKQTIANDIKLLIEYLGEEQAIIIGHDMGGKVAYTLAHVYPQLVKKLILIDCMIPGTENADALHGGAWHYGFHMTKDIPEMLTLGREKEYIHAQIKNWTYNKNAIDAVAISEYAKNYAREGGMTAGFNYYRTLKEDAAFVSSFRGQPLSMPVLTITGRQSVAEKLSDLIQKESPTLKSVIFDECGHFVPEEKKDDFNQVVMRFLDE